MEADIYREIERTIAQISDDAQRLITRAQRLRRASPAIRQQLAQEHAATKEGRTRPR
jgi:hypothetical protein